MILGSLPKSDALRYRCHTILSLQRIMAQLHSQAAAQMPPSAHLQLLAVLQVRKHALVLLLVLELHYSACCCQNTMAPLCANTAAQTNTTGAQLQDAGSVSK